ncbi:MAG: glycosyltransferase [Bacteroidales bacterium]|nr:glycosyltransferase [Bacteroidales bacterium]
MRRVLIISYYWPPTGGSGVQRWVKFAKYLPSLGWQPVVYTPSNPEQLAVDESLMAEIPAEAEVLKQPIREPYAIYHKLMGRGSGKGAGVNPINSQKKSWKQRLMLWIRSNFFVPDPRAGWVRPSVGFLCRYLSEHPVDVIVTTGPPQSVHLIGRGLHRRLGVPWVADFRDPWTRMFFFENLPLLPWVRRRHFKLEQSVLDEATAIVSVTPRVQADFQARTSTPVHLITNGYDEPDFAAELPVRNDGKFRVVHTGLFASDGNPLELWNALAGLCSESADFASRLEIRLAGKVDPEIVEAITEAGLGAQLHLLGYLPHPESVAELRQADIILLPLRHGPEYSKVYPGKIFECMAAVAFPSATGKGQVRALEKGARYLHSPSAETPAPATASPAILGIGPVDSAAAELLRATCTGEMFDWDADPSGFIRDVAAARNGEAGGGCGLRSIFPERVAQQRGADRPSPAAYSRRALTEKLVTLLSALSH